MSRTIRKPQRAIEQNEEQYIKSTLHTRFNKLYVGEGYRTRYVRRKKPDDLYKAQVEAAWFEYNSKLAKAEYDELGQPYVGMHYRHNYSCGKYVFGLFPNYLRKPYISLYHRIEIPWSIEQEIEQLKQQYSEFTRDGHWNETGRNTGFKKAAAKTTRLGNRRLARKIMKDELYDHLPYPNEHDGDFLRWSFW